MVIKLFIEHDRKDCKKFIGKLNPGGKVVFLPKYFKLNKNLEAAKFYEFEINEGDLIEKEKFCILRNYKKFILSKEDKMNLKHMKHIKYDWILNPITYEHIINHVKKYENSKDDLEYILEHLDKYYVGFFIAYGKRKKVIDLINEKIYYNLRCLIKDYIKYNFFRERINIKELKEIIDVYRQDISINALDDLKYIFKNYDLLNMYFTKDYVIKCITTCLLKIKSNALGNYNKNIEIVKKINETNKKYNLNLNNLIFNTIYSIKYQRDNEKFFSSGDDDGGAQKYKQLQKYGFTCPHSNR